MNTMHKFAYSISLLLLFHCSNEPSYNIEFYQRAEEYKQKNPNIVVAPDGKRVFTAIGHSGILDPERAKSAPKSSPPVVDNSPISGEVLSLNPVPDSIGNIYFLGFCQNTGNRSIHYGKVTVRLFDAGKKELTSSFGYCDRKQLMKGEKTPVKVLVQKAPKFASYSASISSDNLTSTDNELPVLQLTNTKLSPGQWKGSYQITGMAKNTSSKPIAYATIIGVTMNSKNKIISVDNAYIGKKNMGPSETIEFRIPVHIANGEIPKTFEVNYDGALKN
ncbi:MAG: hypothetical protein IT569_05520 [Leptospiraceae bacterium]|nr:hypothetical protein [Leptospiraceae bacterium]